MIDHRRREGIDEPYVEDGVILGDIEQERPNKGITSTSSINSLNRVARNRALKILGKIPAALLPIGNNEQLEALKPQRQHILLIIGIALGQEGHLVITHLDEVGLLPDALDPLTGGLGGRPEREADVGVVGAEDAGGLGGAHGGHVRRAAGLRDERDGAVVEDARAADQVQVELVGGQQHVGGRVAVEHELPLAVGLEGDEGESRARVLVVEAALRVDPVLLQDVHQHVPELVVAELRCIPGGNKNSVFWLQRNNYQMDDDMWW